jgi:hypothetical protein
LKNYAFWYNELYIQILVLALLKCFTILVAIIAGIKQSVEVNMNE